MLQAAKERQPQKCANLHVSDNHADTRTSILHGTVFVVLRDPCYRFLSIYHHMRLMLDAKGAGVYGTKINPQGPVAWGRELLATPAKLEQFTWIPQFSTAAKFKCYEVEMARRRFQKYGSVGQRSRSLKGGPSHSFHGLIPWKQSVYFGPSTANNNTRATCMTSLVPDTQRLLDEFAPGCILLVENGSSSSPVVSDVVKDEIGIRHDNAHTYNHTLTPELCAVAAQLYPEDVILWNDHCATPTRQR